MKSEEKPKSTNPTKTNFDTIIKILAIIVWIIIILGFCTLLAQALLLFQLG